MTLLLWFAPPLTPLWFWEEPPHSEAVCSRLPLCGWQMVQMFCDGEM